MANSADQDQTPRFDMGLHFPSLALDWLQYPVTKYFSHNSVW